MALLSDPSFGYLRRQLGLSDSPLRSIIPNETPQLGMDYLRSNEGAQALMSLLGGAANNPMISRLLPNYYNTILNRYRSANAVEPQLQPDQFLNQFDLEKFSKGLSPTERGERPFAYLRGFRVVGQ